MSKLQLRGALGALDLEIPLESLVVVASSDGELARRLVFGVIAARAAVQMAPLLAPRWLPASSRVAPPERGEAQGLPPTFVFRHRDAVWPEGTRVGEVLGILPLLCGARGVGLESRCEACAGAGHRAQVRVDSLIPDPSITLRAGAVLPWAAKNSTFYTGVLESLASETGLDLDLPWKALGVAARNLVLHGNPGTNFKGVIHDLERRVARAGEGRGTDTIRSLMPYLEWKGCALCEGTGLGLDALGKQSPALSWAELYSTPIEDLVERAEVLFAGIDSARAARARASLAECVRVASAFGLGKQLTGLRTEELADASARLLRLAEVLGSGFVGPLYILEEPLLAADASTRESIVAFMHERTLAGDSIVLATKVSPSSEVSRMASPHWYIELAGDERHLRVAAEGTR